MFTKTIFALCGILSVGALSAQTLIYDFTGAATGAPTGSISNITFSNATSNNNLGTVATPVNGTSASSGYAGSSGTNNIGAAARAGVLDITTGTGSAYIEFTMTPSASFALTLQSISFGERSTGTGPQLVTIRTSLDGFATDLASAAVANTSTWTLQSPTFAPISGGLDQPITIRLYGSNGVGSPTSGTINFRLDDISVGATSGAIPEPSTVALGLAGLAGLVALRRRR